MNKIVIGLWLCFTLFVARVLGQLAVYWFNVPFLPSFELWYSGAVSYKLLLASQIVIIGFMAVFTIRFSLQQINQHPGIGKLLLLVSVLYFAVMLIRLTVGIFNFNVHIWFDRPIPTVFHMILASYLFLAARYHLNTSEKNGISA